MAKPPKVTKFLAAVFQKQETVFFPTIHRKSWFHRSLPHTSLWKDQKVLFIRSIGTQNTNEPSIRSASHKILHSYPNKPVNLVDSFIDHHEFQDD